MDSGGIINFVLMVLGVTPQTTTLKGEEQVDSNLLIYTSDIIEVLFLLLDKNPYICKYTLKPMKEGVEPWYIIITVVPFVIFAITLMFILLKKVAKDLDENDEDFDECDMFYTDDENGKNYTYCQIAGDGQVHFVESLDEFSEGYNTENEWDVDYFTPVG